jgi:hypothetical protein
VRRLVLIAAAVFLLAPSSAQALTTAQVEDQALVASFSLTAHLAATYEDDSEIESMVYGCWRNMRTRGSCWMRAESATNHWCVARVIVKQRGRLLVTGVRDVACG